MVLVMITVVRLIADDNDSDHGVDRGDGDSGGWG